MSKSGKLGYAGSLPVPTVHCGVNAFLLGARMVDREIAARSRTSAAGRRAIGPIALQLAGASALDDRDHQVLTDVDPAIHAGEIVGVAGIAGNLVPLLPAPRRQDDVASALGLTLRRC